MKNSTYNLILFIICAFVFTAGYLNTFLLTKDIVDSTFDGIKAIILPFVVFYGLKHGYNASKKRREKNVEVK